MAQLAGSASLGLSSTKAHKDTVIITDHPENNGFSDRGKTSALIR
jgi:hypothetical protein